MKTRLSIAAALFFSSLMLASPLMAMDSDAIEEGREEKSEPVKHGSSQSHDSGEEGSYTHTHSHTHSHDDKHSSDDTHSSDDKK